MVVTWNVAACSAYYAHGSEYYPGAKEPDGVWYAPAGDLGRIDAATVQAKEFARLEGRGVDGQALSSDAGGGPARSSLRPDLFRAALGITGLGFCGRRSQTRL